MATEGLNVLRGAASRVEPSEGDGGFTRRVDNGRRVGRSGPPQRRGRLWHYDRLEGAGGAVLKFTVDKADRLSVDSAREKMSELHHIYGVDREMESVIYAFDYAMFICYALNGASQVGPMERVKFSIIGVDGRHSEFDYDVVRRTLGVDFRRFFRAFANDVVEACRHLYEHCDYDDEEAVAARDMMVMLADLRNLSRAPYLIADCADAAVLSPADMALVIRSKQAVIASSSNAVDKRNLAVPVRSLDNYDSSTGENIAGSNDIHQTAGVGYYN